MCKTPSTIAGYLAAWMIKESPGHGPNAVIETIGMALQVTDKYGERPETVFQEVEDMLTQLARREDHKTRNNKSEGSLTDLEILFRYIMSIPSRGHEQAD